VLITFNCGHELHQLTMFDMNHDVCNDSPARLPDRGRNARIPAPLSETSAMLLTKHEGETFRNQTVYISGQAFIRCSFVACTLVLRETVYHLEGCTFERCNWHVDWVLMWGSPESVREIKALVGMIEQAQQQQASMEAGGGAMADIPGIPSTPFASGPGGADAPKSP
jgi:hypothetical protein